MAWLGWMKVRPDIVVADDAEFEGDAGRLRIAERRRHAAVGDGHHDIGFGRALGGQFRAHALADLVDRAAVHHGIGPGEVDVFEDARSGLLRREGLQALDAALRDDHDLAVLDVAHEARPDDVEGAGLGGQDVAAVEFAKHQRPDAERVARADEFLVGERHQSVGALDLAQRLDEAIHEPRLPRARHKMENDFRIGGRLADGAVAHELLAQRQAVGEVAVMGHGEAATVELREERLNVAQHGLARRGIADMADRGRTRQPLDDGLAREVVTHETVTALGMELAAIEGHDAGRLLPAMLQGMQPQRRDGGSVGMAEDAEDAAFFAQGFGFEIAQ